MQPSVATRAVLRAFRLLIAAALSAGLQLPVGVQVVTAAVPADFEDVLIAEVSAFTPVADSWVDTQHPSSNNGTKTQIRVDASPVLTSYLRFDVQGATDLSKAELRLFFNSSSSAGVRVHPVSNTTWGETTITAANAPPIGAVAATTQGGSSDTWVSVDVSSLVTQNGLLSLALTSTGSTALSMGSRESDNDPQLIVGSGSPPPPADTLFEVSRQGTTSTYQAASSTRTYTGTLKSVVESAIAELNGAGGGTISFTAGDFDLGSDNFELDDVSNITFVGQGISSTTIRNFTNVSSDTEPFDVVVGNNLVFRDLTVRAGGALRSTSDALDFDAGNDILIERVAVTESRGRGIIFDGKGAGWSATGNTVRDCVITGIPGDGIELLASSSNVVEGCTITDVGGHGIQMTKSSAVASQPNKKSSDNRINNNTVTNAGQDGINLNSGDRNEITSNTVMNSADDTSGRDGIRIGSSDSITCNENAVDLNVAGDDQAVKTQSYGLNISSGLCNQTVVGGGNDFSGNRLGAIRDLGTNTQYAPPSQDTQAPTTPTGLQAVAVSGCQVDLSWSASSDNVGVTGYRIYRDGVQVGSVGGMTLAFADATVSPGNSYSYTVDALDAANLASAQSEPATATTPTAPCTATFTPTADSWVDGSQPTANFGTSTQLRVDGSPVLTSYLKFDIQVGTPITGATLRIFVNSNHSTGFAVRSVADNGWSETAITAANAPAYGAVVASSGAFTGGTWVTVDVGSLVTANGEVSLALTTTSSTAASLASRQAGADAPQLVIDTN